MLRKPSLGWFAGALFSHVVLGQEIQESDLVGRIDLAVPDVPAASVLGMSADTIIRPSTGKDFAVSLLNGLGQNGKLQAGLALDVRPALYLAPENFTLEKYRDTSAVDGDATIERYKMRREAYWTKLRLSLATGRAEDEPKDADRYSIGVNWNIFDHGDSRLSPAYRNCVLPILRGVDEEATQLELVGDEVGAAKVKATRETEGAKAVEKCAKDFEAKHWNADSWDVGAAFFSYNTDLLNSDGYAAWTTYARRLGVRGQFILHLRYHEDEVAQDSNNEDALIIQDVRIAGARLRWKAPRGTFLVEATYRDIDRQSGEDDKYTLASVGYEFRIAPGVWIQLAYGKAYGSSAFDNDAVYSGQFKWGYTESSLAEK